MTSSYDIGMQTIKSILENLNIEEKISQGIQDRDRRLYKEEENKTEVQSINDPPVRNIERTIPPPCNEISKTGKSHTRKYEMMKADIEQFKHLPILEVLKTVGFFLKKDGEYEARDDSESTCHYVHTDNNRTINLLVTGEKWYDRQALKGGAGIIDLIMHIYNEEFKDAVQRLKFMLSPVYPLHTKEVMVSLELDKPKKKTRRVPAKKQNALVPAPKNQMDFFTADITGWIPKDDIASMEHPLFALKPGDKKLRVYERNGITVKVAPGYHGHATIHDKDLWIYCISRLVNEKKHSGEQIGRTVRFVMKDFLKSTNRDASGRAYQRAEEMLERLKGTSITTNIKTDNISEKQGFGLIDSWKVIERDGDKRMVSVEVTLSDWLSRSINTMQVLTLSPDYFRLRKALDRRIYELARKHCGQQFMWKVSMTVLHEKSGSTAGLREFRRQVKELAESNGLPDYDMSYDQATDMVTFKRLQED